MTSQNRIDHIKANQARFDELRMEENADVDAYFQEYSHVPDLYERVCDDMGIEPVRAATPRGFGIYAEIRDKYGAKVRVQQSSLATDDCVWIFADDSPEMDNPSPHLNVEQARAIRDGLTAFIEEHE